MAVYEKVWFWLLMVSILLIIGGIIYFMASSNPQFWWVLVWLGVMGVILSLFVALVEGAGDTVSKVVTTDSGRQAILQGVNTYHSMYHTNGSVVSTVSKVAPEVEAGLEEAAPLLLA